MRWKAAVARGIGLKMVEPVLPTPAHTATSNDLRCKAEPVILIRFPGVWWTKDCSDREDTGTPQFV